jgi:hypothetical protein
MVLGDVCSEKEADRIQRKKNHRRSNEGYNDLFLSSP